MISVSPAFVVVFYIHAGNGIFIGISRVFGW